MLTNTQIVAIINTNFADLRMMASSLYVNKLLKRTTYGGGIPQYRMTNKTTGQPITSEAEFLTAIAAEDFTVNFPFDFDQRNTDRVTGFYVTVKNIEVRFTEHAEEDDVYSQYVDFARFPNHVYGIQFYFGYMNDGDADVPLKLIFQRLYHLTQ